ncbi:glycosyltransferase domain-containing protein [Enterobacter hormaechei]|uniref:glycosyltransferase domain-containing protein n=1 Tax=Enterobacter hormaechei TaxID=158836 RepID=UPI0014631C59|nr:glycosyltransferase domain-containing protein [Enterobacter hormaechei]QJQ15133.1 DUF616 domain-containing protein [Enterobacter hormaechei]
MFGDYDILQEPKRVESNIDYICFTDNQDVQSSKWKVIYISDEELKNHSILNRKYKFFPHLFLEKYEQSLYIDGNIQIQSADINIAFDEALSEYDISIPPHTERDCLYEEADVCIRLGKGVPEKIKAQIEKYKNEGYPKNYGLYENNTIFRNHNRPVIKKLMKLWYEELNSNSGRDQLSLCYLMWKNSVKCKPFPWGGKRSHCFFKINLHKNEMKLPLHKKICLRILINEKVNWLYFTMSRFIKQVRK